MNVVRFAVLRQFVSMNEIRKAAKGLSNRTINIALMIFSKEKERLIERLKLIENGLNWFSRVRNYKRGYKN